MPKVANAQPSLKPQDMFVLLALLCRGGGPLSYAELADATGMAVSAVHGSIKRAVVAQLARIEGRLPVVQKLQLKEFLLYGAKYSFPPAWGSLSRGLPTSHAAAPLNAVMAAANEPDPVWAHPAGKIRGITLAPLYPTAPDAALRDDRLYAMLALFDALRSGRARERNAAKDLLEKYFDA